MDNSEVPEFQAVFRCGQKLQELIKHDYHNLAPSLLSSGLISQQTEQKTRLPSTGSAEIANEILDNVRSKIKTEPRLYSDFLKALSHPYYDSIRIELEKELQKARASLSSFSSAGN